MLPGKVFKLREKVEFSTLTATLQGYRVMEKFAEDQYKFDLVTEITNLVHGENSVTGLYFHDTVTYVYHRGKAAPIPKTTQAFFNFTAREDDILLTILQKNGQQAGSLTNSAGFSLTGKVTSLKLISLRRISDPFMNKTQKALRSPSLIEWAFPT